MGLANMIIIQAAFQLESGLPEDRAINTFHYDPGAVAADEAEINLALDAIEGFYTDSHVILTNTVALYGKFSTHVRQDDHTLKAYRHSDPIPRVPVVTRSWDLPANPTAVGFPNEVALCLSYRGPLTSGTIAARRRGRIYFGPLGTTAQTDGGADSRPSDETMQLLATAGDSLRAEMAGISAASAWVVYSPTAAAVTEVEAVWVDNAWDTMRKRGLRPTSRFELP